MAAADSRWYKTHANASTHPCTVPSECYPTNTHTLADTHRSYTSSHTYSSNTCAHTHAQRPRSASSKPYIHTLQKQMAKIVKERTLDICVFAIGRAGSSSLIFDFFTLFPFDFFQFLQRHSIILHCLVTNSSFRLTIVVYTLGKWHIYRPYLHQNTREHKQQYICVCRAGPPVQIAVARVCACCAAVAIAALCVFFAEPWPAPFVCVYASIDYLCS